jgi:hypothetical protein
MELVGSVSNLGALSAWRIARPKAEDVSKKNLQIESEVDL